MSCQHSIFPNFSRPLWAAAVVATLFAGGVLTMAATQTLTPDAPEFWAEHQLVLAKVDSVTPRTQDPDAARAYSLEVEEVLHGDVTVGDVIEGSFVASKLNGPALPEPVVGRLWLLGIHKDEEGNYIVPEVILSIAGHNLPIELTDVNDARLAAIRSAIP